MFKRIKYPDGQISAKWEPEAGFNDLLIKERINSYEDLFYVRSIADLGVAVKLFIPCMFGQRSDKRFSENQSFDLKLIADVINSCGFVKVEIFDPHSDVTLALVNNSVKVSSFPYVKQAVDHMLANIAGGSDILLVSPDAGAYKKVFEYGAELNIPVVAAVKHRDLEGKIDLSFMGDVERKDCLIVDDLCDGGWTFQVLGKKLKEQGARSVHLYVSHGLFSKSFYELSQIVDHIYCTNSINDINLSDHPSIPEGYLTQYKVI